MKNFLKAAFKITLFQVIFIVVLSALKYVLVTYRITDNIQKTLVWIFFIAGILFVIAVGIMGIIEDRGQSVEAWQASPKKTMKEKIWAALASWGYAIPVALAYVFGLYMIIPTSIEMAIALYAGIVIRNCIDFFAKKQSPQI